MILLKLLKESVAGSVYELANNKLRTFLSVLGITIGIFCIITVFSAVDSLERNVRNSFRRLGENVIYVQRFPWTEDPKENQWKYLRRPKAEYHEFKELKEKLTTAEGVAIMLFVKGKTAKYESNVVEDLDIFAMSHDYDKIKDWNFEQGRYFSPSESQFGDNVVIIGANTAEELFPGQANIVGKEIKLLDRKATVIGVLKREGEDIVGFSDDNNVIAPYNYIKTIINMDGWMEPLIALKAKEGVSSAQLKDEARSVLRSVRKLSPREEDNFALNEVSIIGNVITIVFGVINTAGLFIGIFSILVGGFGIANIMFVSVKERTHLIGIKKALGAKRFFILVEFLTEAVLLCVMGGIIGLVLVFIESFVLEGLIRSVAEIVFEFRMSVYNVFIGILFSVVIGIVAGIIPAIFAARMKPVDAIRS
jgi:putative ABC transport system permease protein